MAPRQSVRRVYGLYYRKRLANLDGRLALFWMRSVADLYNRIHLQESGVVVALDFDTKQPTRKMREAS
jgi:hypothetical protein